MRILIACLFLAATLWQCGTTRCLCVEHNAWFECGSHHHEIPGPGNFDCPQKTLPDLLAPPRSLGDCDFEATAASLILPRDADAIDSENPRRIRNLGREHSASALPLRAKIGVYQL